MWGATDLLDCLGAGHVISIHAPRVGSDRTAAENGRLSERFQSTLPVWGATGNARLLNDLEVISIHAPRVGSDDRSPLFPDYSRGISIHAPRVGSDLVLPPQNLGTIYFNPRSPCGERLQGSGMAAGQIQFQSTLPVWGATGCLVFTFRLSYISIHAPRVGSDTADIAGAKMPRDFNPRSSCGERPINSPSLTPHHYFNPRSPCGERLVIVYKHPTRELFQSTLPVWGATMRSPHFSPPCLFQSTLPVWGATFG